MSIGLTSWKETQLPEPQFTPPLFTKQQIGIAILASLVATSGAVGATVISQSTISGNKIVITAPTKPTNALVTASGKPMHLEFKEGTSIDRGKVAVTSIRLENSGETAATVRIKEAKGLALERINPNNVSSVAHLGARLETGGVVFSQKISVPLNPAGAYAEPITVPAKGSATVEAYFEIGDSKVYKATDQTFDLVFEYSDKVS